MNHTEDEHIEAWELEWQDYASDPNTLDQKAGGLALLLLWATCIIVCLAVWAAVIHLGIWAGRGVIHWIQGLL